jgi:hypothetical protein
MKPNKRANPEVQEACRPHGLVLEELATRAPRLRLMEHAPDHVERRRAVLARIQEVLLLVERRYVKPH